MLFSKQLNLIQALLFLNHAVHALDCIKMSQKDITGITWTPLNNFVSIKSDDSRRSKYRTTASFKTVNGPIGKSTEYANIEYISTVWRKWATGKDQYRALTIEPLRMESDLYMGKYRIEYEMREWTNMPNVNYWLENYDACEATGIGEDGRRKVPFYADEVKAIHLYNEK